MLVTSAAVKFINETCISTVGLGRATVALPRPGAV